ncbi:hypothetical protein [Gulosibacter faecalis]|jgi:hypothetical protein|uniref:Lipoprotein n=1 Tax=Gulosibacter faecalis TaxID=272240 RepID=A0ABW5UXT2_9MICO|nr:hypothetical protein [Gulosibacter faecalis]
MPYRLRPRIAGVCGVAGAAAVALLLTACAGVTTSTPGESVDPTTAPIAEPTPTQPTNTSPFGGEGAPAPTDGSSVDVPTQSAPANTTSRLETFEVGDDDYADLDWHVSCSGLDSSPTIIASADDGDTHLTLVVIGSGVSTLGSITLTMGESGASSHNSSGITVNPGANQGNGSLEVSGSSVSSSGRGAEFGPDAGDAEVIYDFEAVCASA